MKPRAQTDRPQLPCILSVAYPFAPVGSGAVGGAEVILSEIEAALPALGFGSVVVAHAASSPRGRLYGTAVPPGEITDATRPIVEEAHQQNLDRALAENPVALVHMHGLSFHRYRVPAHIPVVVTLHLPPSWYPETIWSLPANFHFVCVSETERESCPPQVRDRITVIGNGVPLPDPATLRPAGRYALMLSRICPEKNLHTGLSAARLAGMPALLAGEIFPYETHQRYFADEIQPRLTALGTAHEGRADEAGSTAEARFLGPITGAPKARLLARAACLLVPSLAPETSSLCAMEALAAGVPVIAMASGAVPEIIEDGRTGFLIDPRATPGEAPAAAMARAIGRLPEIDRRLCRRAAEQRFTVARMIEGYALLYRRYALPDPAPLRKPGRKNGSKGEAQAEGVPQTIARRETRHGDSDAPPERNAARLDTRVELLTENSQLAALAPAWRALWRADPLATPFQHPAWLLPWWRQFGPDGELASLALRDGDSELRALLPTYIYPEPQAEDQTGSQTTLRKLLFIGSGTTDHLDGLFDPAADLLGLAHTALRALTSPEAQPSPDGSPPVAFPGLLDSVSLMQLPASSPLLTAAEAPDLRCLLTCTPADPCAVLPLSVELPAKVAANARRYARRAATQGTLSCTVAQTSQEALASFKELVQLQNQRWQERDEAGVLADPRVSAHHREAIPALLEAGLLRLFRLALQPASGPNTQSQSNQQPNTKLLGVLYALADPPERTTRTLYLYLIGFDTSFAALSPGTLLLHAVWQHAKTEGFATLDLLRGGESYKHLWGAQPSPTFALRRR